MKRIILFILLVLVSGTVSAQGLNVQSPIPTGINTVLDNFGNDILISPQQPAGSYAGITRANGTMYLAVNDTLSTANLGLIVFQSTNNGNTWALMPSGITLRQNMPRIKMIAPSADSVLVFFQFGNSIGRWNIITNSTDVFDSTNVTDFDVVNSSTGSIYLMWTNPANQLRRLGSVDGGFTWSGAGLVASNTNRPRLTKSATGDTLVVNYRSGTTVPVQNHEVRSFRYRETTPGTISSTGSSVTVIPAGSAYNEYKSVFRGSTMWFFYTETTLTTSSLFCKVSTNNGVGFGTAIPVGDLPNSHEYWFDAALGTGASFTGVDVIFFADSGSAGNPEKVMYTSASATSPETFPAPVLVSNRAPIPGSDFFPAITEIPGQSDFGVAWVGLDGANRRLYYDRFSLVTSVTDPAGVPPSYILNQNYPNPFNPATKIAFSITRNGFTSLKVYDMLGKEVAQLVAKELTAGNYEVDFNASNLSSGIYFYRLDVNGFTDVKKMTLLR
jgi:hypothetical protein